VDEGGKIVVCLDKTFYSLWVRETSEQDTNPEGPSGAVFRTVLGGGPAGPEKLCHIRPLGLGGSKFTPGHTKSSQSSCSSFYGTTLWSQGRDYHVGIKIK